MGWMYNGETLDEGVLIVVYLSFCVVFALIPVIMICVCIIRWCTDHYPIFSNEEIAGNGNRSTEEVNYVLRQERALGLVS